ncbi:hypothetical protein WR25_07082 isoform C [Diploscapter pachys]|uniref:SMC hinge domain-containing protein n=1 Tax=Diploscapter pachys TaxID=2018661 RepID=A0A2A2LMD4_9BILA|nr:hypothetical protein WR25_07082 isoform B [Diploscapter pachys]PAV87387.1 hypothetical protein WR25_07082 isoform C [Diploscapter pachys]
MQLNIAKSKKEEIVMALDVLEYPQELESIVKNVCKNQVLCESMDTMTEITNKFKLTAVTAKGAVSRTGGHMAGGHDSRTPLFNLLANYKDLVQQETQIQEEIKQTEGELRNMGGAKARFAELQRKKEVLEMELNAIEDRKKNSRPAQLQSDIDTYKQEVADLNKEVQELTPKIDELNAKIADATKQQKNLKAYQADQKKKLQKELKECQDRMKANKDKTDKLKRDLENKEQEIVNLRDQITAQEGEINGLNDAIENRKKTIEEKIKAVTEKQAEVDELEKKLADLRRACKEKDEKLKKMQKETDAKRKERQEKQTALQDKTKRQQRCVEDAEKYKKEADKLYKKNEKFFDDIKALLGQKGSIYDFTGYTDKTAEAKINELNEEMKEVEKKFNKNVIHILDTAEQRVSLRASTGRDESFMSLTEILEKKLRNDISSKNHT